MCVSACLRSTGQAIGPTDLKFGMYVKAYDISVLSLKVKVKDQGQRGQKCKNFSFSLVSENVVQGQGHEGQDQGHTGQGHRSRSKLFEEFCTPLTRGRCNTRAFSFIVQNLTTPVVYRIVKHVSSNQSLG